MIEAVNSVLSNAPLARGNADQADVSRAVASAPAQVQSVAAAPLAPYISPYISIDTNYDKAVLQIRDSDTGDVLTQFPSESRLQAQAAQAARQQSTAGTSAPAPQDAGENGGSDFTGVQQADSGGSPVGLPVAQAQAASAALATGAQAGVEGLSAGVTVLA